MYRSKHNRWRWLILGLIAIGAVQLLIHRPFTMISLAAVVGILYYLYKHPPRWLIRFSHPHRHPIPKSPKRKVSPLRDNRSKYARKRRSFRVIEGNKKDPLKKMKTQ